MPDNDGRLCVATGICTPEASHVAVTAASPDAGPHVMGRHVLGETRAALSARSRKFTTQTPSRRAGRRSSWPGNEMPHN
jgi:hypothetical protein